MDKLQRKLIDNGTQALSPIRSQIYQSHSPSPDTSSPVLVVSVLGIIITAFLLLSYYVFVIKFWLNCHRVDAMRRFSISRSRRYEDPLMGYDPSAATENRGVGESVIRAIPIFQFKREGEEERRSLYECAVCLNEFQDEERLRVLPSCSHAFHIDCIDIWLQNNANCPLCRSSICSTTARVNPFDQIIAPSCSPQDQSSFRENIINSDLDFVVIEVRGGDNVADHTTRRRRETVQCINSSPRKLEQRLINKKARKFQHVSSMGDEWIDIRDKDDQFSIQHIRRSFSMDSSTDRQLYLAIQDIRQQSRHLTEGITNEGCSSRAHRRFFSFGHSQGSRKAILPIRYEA